MKADKPFFVQAFNDVGVLMSVSFRPVSYLTFGQKTEVKQFPQEVALFSDIDRTAIDWTQTGGYHYNFPAIQTLGSVMNRDELRRGMLRGLTTGKGLHCVRELADILAPLPSLHTVALNDGQMIFLNEKGLPTKEWIQSLTLEDQDPVWRDYLEREKGWEIRKVMDTVQTLLDTEGYKPHPDAANRQSSEEPNRTITCRPMTQDEINASFEHPEQLKALGEKPIVVVARYSDQSYLEVRIENTTLSGDIGPISQDLSNKIIGQLQAEKIKATGYAYSVYEDGPAFMVNPDPQKYRRAFVHYGPEGIEKSSATQKFIQMHMPNLAAFMTAGDSPNDEKLLRLDSVWNPQTEKGALNYPIQLGDHPALKSLASLPRLIALRLGELAQGITEQWQKIMQARTPRNQNPEGEGRFRKVA